MKSYRRFAPIAIVLSMLSAACGGQPIEEPPVATHATAPPVAPEVNLGDWKPAPKPPEPPPLPVCSSKGQKPGTGKLEYIDVAGVPLIEGLRHDSYTRIGTDSEIMAVNATALVGPGCAKVNDVNDFYFTVRYSHIDAASPWSMGKPRVFWGDRELVISVEYDNKPNGEGWSIWKFYILNSQNPGLSLTPGMDTKVRIVADTTGASRKDVVVASTGSYIGFTDAKGVKAYMGWLVEIEQFRNLLP